MSFLNNNRSLERFLIAIFAIVLVVKLLNTLVVYSHGDAYNYHLVVPRLIFESGLIDTLKSFFPIYLGGYGEFLYLIPIAIFGNSIKAVLMAQFFHFSITVIGSIFLVKKYLWKKDSHLISFLVIALQFLTISKGADFLFYAKNDGYIALLCLWIFLELMTKRPETWNVFILGALFGLAPSIKLSSLVLIVPCFLFLFWQKRKEIRFPIIILSMAFIIHLPILMAKHIYLGGAYLFPSLLSVFPGNLSAQSITQWNAFANKALTLNVFGKNLLLFFLPKVSLIFLWIGIYKFRKDREIQTPILILIGSFLIYLILNGGVYSERFFFPITFCQFTILLLVLNKWRPSKKVLWAILLITMVDSKIDKSIKRIGSDFYPTMNGSEAQIIAQKIPFSNFWKSVEVKNEKTYVFSDDFAQTYFSPKGVRLHHYPTAPVTAEFGEKADDCLSHEFLDKYSYFLMSYRYTSKCNDVIKGISKKIKKIGNYELRVRNERNEN